MTIQIKAEDVEFNAIKAQGPGGQHVNTSATAMHLRFDVWASSLPTEAKQKICALEDERISKDGIIIIKAQRERSQLRNKTDALQRLNNLVELALKPRKRRLASKPSKAAKQNRLDDKSRTSQKKQLRNQVRFDDD